MPKDLTTRTPLPYPISHRRALDPFFVFTYSLLVLAALIQFAAMIWLDLG